MVHIINVSGAGTTTIKFFTSMTQFYLISQLNFIIYISKKLKVK